MTPLPPALQAQCRLDSPLGPLTAAATAGGLAGLWFDGQAHHPGPLATPVDPDHPVLQAAARALARCWTGQAPAQAVPLDLHGTPFQRAVWLALLAIPRGHTSTYGAVAHAAGRPAAVRAAGAAIGRNPVSVLVPCHRVLGAQGQLTGYAGGLPRKKALLALEAGVGLATGALSAPSLTRCAPTRPAPSLHETT